MCASPIITSWISSNDCTLMLHMTRADQNVRVLHCMTSEINVEEKTKNQKEICRIVQSFFKAK